MTNFKEKNQEIKVFNKRPPKMTLVSALGG